jgi:NAD(P)-dependent dehydrogenase (short-subunit alcohol dehydrogenase family)
VRVHCISPSYIDGSDALNRLAGTPVEGRMEKARQRAGLGLPSAADVAPLALFLCSDGARRITGQVISVNGGLNA